VSADSVAADGPGMVGPVPFDPSVANPARVYDYGLGGKDNFAADRAAGDLVLEAYPDIVASVRATRHFLRRAVRYLADEAGVRQFLDIGVGMPADDSTHEVAQSVAPESRIVYVDNDPVVVAHARALLISGPAGATAHLLADLREPARIIEGAAQALDLSQPVAVILNAVLQQVPDDGQAHRAVAGLRDAVPPGSYLVISHPASDIDGELMARLAEILNRLTAQEGSPRDQAGVARFFEGLDLVQPGVVQAQQWRPGIQGEAAVSSGLWAGVARKP
jgi:S-adenosyl methyltransferase